MDRIEIVGTDPDGYFVARVYTGKTEFALYYNPHEDTAYLNKYIDYFTRFSVFYENDEKLHKGMIAKLKNCKIEGDVSLKKLLSEFL